MDPEQNDRQHEKLFDFCNDFEKRITKLEIHQEHDKLKADDHKETLKSHSKEIRVNSDWIMKATLAIGLGGVILKMLWDHFQG